MSLPSVTMSASKRELFNVLGWQTGVPHFTQLYESMAREAIGEYEELVSNPALLRPQSQGQAPPYSYNDFTELALDRAVANITRNASATTFPWFNRGADVRRDQYWVARWFLWHIFRYRDPRNKGKARRRNNRSDDEDDDDLGNLMPKSPPTGGMTDSMRARAYDPVRDG